MNKNVKVFGWGFIAGSLTTFLVGGGIIVLLAYFSYKSGKFPMNVKNVVVEASPVEGDVAVTNLLKPIQQKYGLPAIAGAIVTSKGISTVGMVGVRKSGTTIAATLNDQWHLGSDTKAMTATLAGKLVEEGVLSWNTTVADIFPELASGFNPQMKSVTLLELLAHRAGLPENLSWTIISWTGTVHDQRIRALKESFSEKPLCTPGTQYQYSNLGYVIVGAMIEKVTGMSWEDAIKEKLFKPLDMKSVGFGGTGTVGKIDEPWGHTASGQPVFGNGPSADNPPVMGPAGEVHCTIQDWGKFIADQLRGDEGKPALLKSATYQTLHTPPFGGDYAMGWILANQPWGGGTVFNHGGSNGMNFANVWMAPKKDFAILICTNEGDAFQATNDVVGALIQLQESMTQGMK